MSNGSPGFAACLQRRGGLGVGKGRDQRVAEILAHDLLQEPGGGARAVAVVGEHDGLRTRATACFASATPSEMRCTFAAPSSASRFRQANWPMSSIYVELHIN
jgi:hypothetical protein